MATNCCCFFVCFFKSKYCMMDLRVPLVIVNVNYNVDIQHINSFIA